MSRFRLHVAGVVLALGVTGAARADSTCLALHALRPRAPLRDLAACADVHVGAAFVQNPHDPGFLETLAREFDSATVGLYWSSTNPSPGVYDFRDPDGLVDFAVAHGLRLRGHPLFWGRLALPAFVNATTDPAALRALLADRVATTVGRYRGRIAHWDVVNEPLTFLGAPGSTDGLDSTVFLRVLGPGFFREALDLAHAADPGAKLFINEFGVEKPGPKQDRFFRLVQELLAAGAPLDGVGFQGHVRVPFMPDFQPTRAELEAAVRRFAALGIAVELTEIDVTMPDTRRRTLVEQRRIYRDLYDGCLAVPGCTGLTTWGLTDKSTWIRDFFAVEGAPLLFDASYRPKPAYAGVRQALRRAARRAAR